MLVDFWATWCPPCMAEADHMVEVHNKYKNQGLQIEYARTSGAARYDNRGAIFPVGDEDRSAISLRRYAASV